MPAQQRRATASATEDITPFDPISLPEFRLSHAQLTRPFVLPAYLTEAERYATLQMLVAGLRAGGAQVGPVHWVPWKHRSELADKKCPLRADSGAVVVLVVRDQVASDDLALYLDRLGGLTVLDLREPHPMERLRWLHEIKNAVLDGVQRWWDRCAASGSAHIAWTDVSEYIEAPTDAMLFCNVAVRRLLRGFPPAYAMNRGLAEVLVSRAVGRGLSSRTVASLLTRAIRWADQPSWSMPSSVRRTVFEEWQKAGLGRIVGGEFLPLRAVIRLADPDRAATFVEAWHQITGRSRALDAAWAKLRPPTTAATTVPTHGEPLKVIPLGHSVAYPGFVRVVERIRSIVTAAVARVADADDDGLMQMLETERDRCRRLLIVALRMANRLDSASNRLTHGLPSPEARAAVVAVQEQWASVPHRPANPLEQGCLRAWSWLACGAAEFLLSVGEDERTVSIANDLARRGFAVLPDQEGLGHSSILTSLALRSTGRLEDALERAQEAVDIYRGLAASHPDAFVPYLAASLNNLAAMLSELGRREEALERAQEAVDIYRRLAASRPDAFLPYHAGSLNNLSNTLSDLGRREEALQCAQGAVGIYRGLAASRPGALLPDLAMSLNNLANTLSALGRSEEALERAQEGVGIYRGLAASRPDAFLPDLAMSLNNLANKLGALGRREEALDHAQEAVEVYRSLAESNPDVFRPYLAGSLNNLANTLSAPERREEALESAQEAVDINRGLAASRQDVFLPDLARSLAVLGVALRRAGRLAEAAASFGEAIRTLTPAFLSVQAAYSPMMSALIGEYVHTAQSAGIEPDRSLLGPVPELQAIVNVGDSARNVQIAGSGNEVKVE